MIQSDAALGVNETELDNLILALDSNLDSISSSLSQIQMTFYDSKDYFKGDVADNFLDKFEVYNQQIPLLKANLKTYINDLLVVKEYSGNVDSASAKHIQNAKDETNRNSDNVKQDNHQILLNTTVQNNVQLSGIRYELRD